MKYLYIVYQYLIALPILVVATIFTAVTTIVFFPFKRARWLHGVQVVWARLFCYLMFLPVTVTGKENIVKGQSYVFVSNHQSMFDVWVIYGWLPVIFKWLMKQELRHVPFVGLACKAAGHVYVNRRNLRSSAESIREVEKVLCNGVSTVIFPEGTRTETGEMGKFKRGAFQIALDLNLPVIPISLSGCYQVINKHGKYVNRHPIHMHIGKPIVLTEISNGDPQAAIDYVYNEVKKGIIE